jgi:cytochrome P450
MIAEARLQALLDISIEPDLFLSHEAPLMSPELAEDPHQFLDGVRARCGDVFEIRDNQIDGINFPTLIPMVPSRPGYMVTGYHAVSSVLKNQQTFYQNHTHNMDALMGDGQIAGLNPPHHANLRSLLFQSFNKQSVDELQENVILPLMNCLIDRLAEKNEGDLVREFTCRVPTYLIGEIFDLPIERYNNFAGLVADLMNFGASWEKAIAASEAFKEIFLELIEERKRKPGDDLISRMLEAELDGQKLTDTEMMSFCRALVPAGIETTTRAMSTLFTAVLGTPGCWELLKANPDLVSAAVEEMMRWNAPVQMIPKRTTTDVELGGALIPAESNLWIQLGNANRDAGQWENPHRYDITRQRKPNLGFSQGAHLCLGNQLARRELHDALKLMLKRLPDLKLDPDTPPPVIKGFQFRSADQIDVVTGVTH